jgi:CheY-like chemotaxis protein
LGSAQFAAAEPEVTQFAVPPLAPAAISAPPFVAPGWPLPLTPVFAPDQALAGQNAGRGLVLVVDDEQGIREVIAEVLQDDGYEVVTAGDGAAALALLAEPGGPAPAVILLDMRMPGFNGWDFAKAYRALPGPHAPIVAISAAQDASQYAREIAANAHLGKPFEIAELLTLVEDLTRHRAG